MMQYESETHTCVVSKDGYITVDRKSIPQVTETTPAGSTVRHASQLFGDTSFLKNEFIANFNGSGYNVDLNCGCQRWNGVQSNRKVGRALKVCGFNSGQRRNIMRIARKHTHGYLIRQF